ncbi:chromosome partitioning protein [Mucilaginibacter pineti]|uniref:Chromosome partitioning protein n=1 Tax=Mucilaginibacter pineti TaxID=1391627 RepID=A0A1G7IGP2_9SPHI|nr:ParA family protein [Mucilaginibacter pineti]SDF11803.1 chromosome partitioning protein [Mucilaginibacter pineti]
MVILIGNQKGGAGKSTLTLLLANYLATVRNRKLTILDMDYQQSIAAKAEKAKILENAPLYEVIPSDLKHFPVLLNVMDQDKNKPELVVIDLPGKMDDDGLIPVFLAGDIILCPFNYDELSVDSTLLFAMVIKKINNRAPLIFIPNRIKNTVKYETREEVDKVLAKFGVVTPGITDRVDFQRVSTLHIPAIVLPSVLPVLDLIYEQYLLREEHQ